MKSRKSKKFVSGKRILLSDFAAAKKNYEDCVANNEEYPLSSKAREEGRDISVISQNIEEYYKILKTQLVEAWQQTDTELGLERSAGLLVEEYEDIIAQLDAGKKVPTSFEGAKLERYAISKICENFFLREKMQLCEIAFNAVQIEERTNVNGEFSKLGTHAVTEPYIQSMIDLDAKHSLAVQDDHILAANAVVYEGILSEKKLALTATDENV